MARKILLADDSVTAQNMGRKILADAGYDVTTVNNGSAALKRVSEVKPDLIVLDVYMPGYSGLEVCQRLKENAETEHIPILLTVGKLEPFKPEEARRVRADAHIIKPFEASELLTAITKLEDRMVPMQADGSRFGGSVSGVERFSGDSKKSPEADTSWKNRLRFPSKKKKEEPEPEPDDAEVANYRDFRKGKSKNTANAAFSVKAPPPPGQEPGLVPDIPRDITPEELDALSALAAKLDGPIPAAENIAPLAEKMGPRAAPVAEAATSSLVETAKPDVAAAVPEIPSKAPEPAPAARAVEEFAVEAPAPVASTAPVEIPAAPAEAVALPVAEAVLATESKTDEAVRQADPAAATEEVQKSEAPVIAPVSAGSFAQEPAPIDRSDEPAFADAAKAAEQVAEAKASDEKTEEKAVEAVAESQTAAQATDTKTAVEAVAVHAEANAEDSKVAEVNAEIRTEVAKTEEPKAEAPEPQEPSPTDEELAEALRLLTPSAGQETATPSHGTLVAAGQLLAEEAARNASNSSRWMAQPVTLSPEEVTLSLEAEMQAFAATAATLSAASSGTMETATVAGVSAIEAAVETRLGSVAPASPAKDPAEPEVATPAAVHKVTAFVVASAQEPAQPQQTTPEKTEAIASKPEPGNDAAEEAAPVTFADVTGKDEVEAEGQETSSAQSQESVEEEEQKEPSPEIGEQESMAKAKSGKSTWHQIHTAAPAAAASKDTVEAAKQAEPAEETPKAMAAAASAETANTAAPTPDAGAIASIVDSVMADLRPKIVEEIAKKLAGK